MKKYYIENGKIIINRYIVKYEDIINNIDSEVKTSITKYVSNQGEFNSLVNELEMKGIKYNTETMDIDDIIQYDNMEVSSEEEARKIINPTIEELISGKIKEISDNCKNNIYNGIDVELNNGDIKHFSLKIEDQINLNSLINQISIGNIKAEEGVPYHADGEMVTLFSIADFTIISKAASAFILQQTTYCNHLMNYIKSLKNIDEIRTVTYGQKLKNNFLNSYNCGFAR